MLKEHEMSDVFLLTDDLESKIVLLRIARVDRSIVMSFKCYKKSINSAMMDDLIEPLSHTRFVCLYRNQDLNAFFYQHSA